MSGMVRSDAYIGLLRAIVDLRNANGLSQANLAVRLGKPPSFVGKYELGERRLDIIEVFVILDALGVAPLEFLESEISDLPNKL